ncbi:MAG: peptide-methionine (S)-S-oxide reductase MsrA [Candidatus Thermoplasmatota archaeon]|nr:peptide-methionine (S)-S-oxide reductase MsrA [Candidatus Thermoplasmatota archaeon]
MEQALFGAGCFWGVQASFDQLEGVVETEVGYSGGQTRNPTYNEVCTENTGHAEVIRVLFDPGVIEFRELLDHFFDIHDPTTMNRQGPDIGLQYRSVVFFDSLEQEREAQDAKKRWNEKHSGEAVTEILPAGAFYRAEEYHQKYFEKNGYIGCDVHL